jgi:hypothetical protein
MRAPIRSSGTITRRIGRRCSDSSPVMDVVKGCAARMPASIRMVLPELPASSTADDARRPRMPRPATVIWRPPASSPVCWMSTPRARRQAMVEAQSPPVEYPRIVEGPRAMAASSAYRWEIPLSPGGRTVPRTRGAGCTRTVCGEDMAEL